MINENAVRPNTTYTYNGGINGNGRSYNQRQGSEAPVGAQPSPTGRTYSREAWLSASARQDQQERQAPQCDILEHVATINTNSFNGDTVELNVVSWNGGREKLDLRKWRGGAPSGGVCLDADEGRYLLAVLTDFYGSVHGTAGNGLQAVADASGDRPPF